MEDYGGVAAQGTFRSGLVVEADGAAGEWRGPDRARSRVILPKPERPMTTVMVPGWKSVVTLLSPNVPSG